LNKNDYSNSSESKFFNLIFEQDKKIKIKDIFDKKILYQELHEKQYNISSFLIKLLISLSSLFKDNLFDLIDAMYEDKE